MGAFLPIALAGFDFPILAVSDGGSLLKPKGFGATSEQMSHATQNVSQPQVLTIRQNDSSATFMLHGQSFNAFAYLFFPCIGDLL